jgi:hypothetical protein
VVLSIEEAKAIMAGGLGKAELEFITSLTAPIFWLAPGADGKFQARNGSAFFVDAGHGPFGITADHVLRGWQEDHLNFRASQPLLGAPDRNPISLDFNGNNRIIARHEKLDITTFRMIEREIAAIGRTILTGIQKKWPPPPPMVDRGIYTCGFPGTGTLWLSRNELSFGAVPGSGVASSVSDRDISSLIERDQLIGVLGGGVPPENFDFRGISGGPMLAVVETGTLRSWMLAGVIYEGPNPSEDPTQAIAGLEIIRARRAHFLLPDGQLDVALWESLA